MKKIKAITCYFFGKWTSWIPIVLFVGVVIIVRIVQGSPRLLPGIDDAELFSDYLDPVIGIGTFLVALFLGARSIYTAWVSQLPIRATFVYIYQHDTKNENDDSGNPIPKYLGLEPEIHYMIMYSKECIIPHAADLRNTAQSYGSALSGISRLDLLLYNYYGSPEIIYLNESNMFVVHYVCGLMLRTIPQDSNRLIYSEDNQLHTRLDLKNDKCFVKLDLQQDLKNCKSVLNLFNKAELIPT